MPGRERIPPAEPASEAYVVQACLGDRQAVAVARALVDPADFVTPSLADAFDAVGRLHDAGQDTGYASVIEWVPAERREPVRAAYRAGTGSTLVARHARAVAEAATLRRLLAGLGEAAELAYAGDIGAVDAARGFVDGLALPRGNLEPSPDVEAFMAVTEEYDWVVPGLVERSDRFMLTGNEGSGKALALDTPVPTPKGWATMADLAVGDEVFGADGERTRIVAVTPTLLGRPCYRMVFSDGAAVVADASHDWVTETRTQTTAQIRSALLSPSGGRQPVRVRGPHDQLRYVESVEPVESVPVRCIQVERQDGTFVVGHQCVPTHNSMLLRQMAVSVAAGMHPFEYHPFLMSNGALPRVSVFDMENSPNTVRRKMAPMLAIEGVRHHLDPARLRIECRPGGIDLTSRRDRGWLIERVMANRPDVVVIGPVYKLYEGDPNDERLARAVTSVLDDVRTRFGCALLIEAHAPHGEQGRKRDLRPFGSSLWRRWPEFGYGIAPAGDNDKHVWFRAWRGDRDERDWPARLERSSPWPWGTGRDVGRVVPAVPNRYEPDDDKF